MTAAVNQLVEIGALQPVIGRKADYELTALGNCLALLPVDTSAGKMLVYGAMLRCVIVMFLFVSGSNVLSRWLTRVSFGDTLCVPT